MNFTDPSLEAITGTLALITALLTVIRKLKPIIGKTKKILFNFGELLKTEGDSMLDLILKHPAQIFVHNYNFNFHDRNIKVNIEMTENILSQFEGLAEFLIRISDKLRERKASGNKMSLDFSRTITINPQGIAEICKLVNDYKDNNGFNMEIIFHKNLSSNSIKTLKSEIENVGRNVSTLTIIEKTDSQLPIEYNL